MVPPEDTVGLIIWSAVELAVMLFCVGLPTLAPLYRRRDFDKSGFQQSGHYDERRSSKVRLTDFDGQGQYTTTVLTGDKFPLNSEQYIKYHSDEEGARMDRNDRIHIQTELEIRENRATSVSRDDTENQGRAIR